MLPRHSDLRKSARPRWWIMTPLGRPVDPEVKRKYARLLGSTRSPGLAAFMLAVADSSQNPSSSSTCRSATVPTFGRKAYASIWSYPNFRERPALVHERRQMRPRKYNSGWVSHCVPFWGHQARVHLPLACWDSCCLGCAPALHAVLC